MEHIAKALEQAKTIGAYEKKRKINYITKYKYKLLSTLSVLLQDMQSRLQSVILLKKKMRKKTNSRG